MDKANDCCSYLSILLARRKSLPLYGPGLASSNAARPRRRSTDTDAKQDMVLAPCIFFFFFLFPFRTLCVRRVMKLHGSLFFGFPDTHRPQAVLSFSSHPPFSTSPPRSHLWGLLAWPACALSGLVKCPCAYACVCICICICSCICMSTHAYVPLPFHTHTHTHPL